MRSTSLIGQFHHALLILCAALLWDGVISGAHAAVNIDVGDNWQTIVNANPAGTQYVIAAGTHRQQSVTPKSGDRFTGRYGAVMSGAKILTSGGFVADGGTGRYYITGQTQYNGQYPYELDYMLDGHEQEAHPEDLFVDGVRWKHVNSLTECDAANEWFFDYAADRIYIYGNPSGRTVETSCTTNAFVEGTNVSDVIIENLTVQNYSNGARPRAAVHAMGTGWTVRYCTITRNHGCGVYIGTGGHAHHNKITHNGQMGMGGGGNPGPLIENNEIAYNKELGFDWGWEGGGTKFSRGIGTIIRNNWSHHNYGPGLWCDIDNVDNIIHSNLVENNQEIGIFYEISYGADIYWNIVRNNNPLGHTGDESMAIYISSSSDCEVYGNWTYGNRHEIFARNGDRGSGSLGLWECRNLKVHDNDMTIVDGSPGLRITFGDITTYNSQKGNEYYDNIYRLDNPSTATKWLWSSESPTPSAKNQSQWKNSWSYGGDAGNDINGTFLDRSQPGGLPAGATAFTVSNYGVQNTSAAPVSLAAAAVSSSQINLSWTDNAGNEDGYRIERKTGEGGSWGEIHTTGPNVTSYQNTGLSTATQYYYRVRSYNVNGYSAYSNEANATTHSNSQAVVSFTLYNADTGQPISGYNPMPGSSTIDFTAIGTKSLSIVANTNPGTVGSVRFDYDATTNFRTENAAPYAIAGDGGGGTDLYAWTPALGGHTLTATPFTVSGGGGTAGTPLTITFTVLETPLAPSSLGATAVSSSQINLSWTDNATNETGFKIESKTGSGGSWEQIGTVGANVTSYQNTGLSASTQYYYRVQAYHNDGNSAYSNEANATTTYFTAGPFAAWQQAHFSADQLADAAISGETATPVSDAVPNLIKYALGLDPWTVGLGDAFQTALTDGHLHLTFDCPAGLTDLTYEPEASTDLATWTPLPLTIISSADGIQTCEALDPVGSSTASRRFIRLRIRLQR